MFAHLVTGRYGLPSEGGSHANEVPKTGWLRRVLAALLSRKK
jgi:hypothetical protein